MENLRLRDSRPGNRLRSAPRNASRRRPNRVHAGRPGTGAGAAAKSADATATTGNLFLKCAMLEEKLFLMEKGQDCRGRRGGAAVPAPR